MNREGERIACASPELPVRVPRTPPELPTPLEILNDMIKRTAWFYGDTEVEQAEDW